MPSKVVGQAAETVWTGAVGGTGGTVNTVGKVGTRGWLDLRREWNCLDPDCGRDSRDGILCHDTSLLKPSKVVQ